MVREQESAKVPFSPTKTNVQREPQVLSKNQSNPLMNLASMQKANQPHPSTTEEPEFGRPTEIGVSRQLHATHRPEIPTGSAQSSSVSSRQIRDPYSGLFIPARPQVPRPQESSGGHLERGMHTVQDLGQQQIGSNDHPCTQSKPKMPFPSTTSLLPSTQRLLYPSTSNEVFEITRPANFPKQAPRPTGPPIFSSHTNTNPYFGNQNCIGLT